MKWTQPEGPYTVEEMAWMWKPENVDKTVIMMKETDEERDELRNRLTAWRHAKCIEGQVKRINSPKEPLAPVFEACNRTRLFEAEYREYLNDGYSTKKLSYGEWNDMHDHALQRGNDIMQNVKDERDRQVAEMARRAMI
jgi:hypothetical protein